MKINENQWKSMKINENHWLSRMSTEHYKVDVVILCSFFWTWIFKILKFGQKIVSRKCTYYVFKYTPGHNCTPKFFYIGAYWMTNVKSCSKYGLSNNDHNVKKCRDGVIPWSVFKNIICTISRNNFLTEL